MTPNLQAAVDAVTRFGGTVGTVTDRANQPIAIAVTWPTLAVKTYLQTSRAEDENEVAQALHRDVHRFKQGRAISVVTRG